VPNRDLKVLDAAEQAAQMVNDLIDRAGSQPVGGDREDAELVEIVDRAVRCYVVPPFVAVRDFAQSGISRRLGFRAVRDSAPFGIWRRSGRAPFMARALSA
jgi:hypothetical protein